MRGLPSGTWHTEVRSIGLARQSKLVDVADDGRSPVTITVDDRPPVLDAVTVIGERSYNSILVDDIIRRHRASSGKAFLPGNIWLEGALYPADVLRAAPGFQYKSPDFALGRAGCPLVAVYLDGMLIQDGFRGLNSIINVRDVLAIEAYQDITFAPPQYHKQIIGYKRDGSPQFACAIVLVWLRR